MTQRDREQVAVREQLVGILRQYGGLETAKRIAGIDGWRRFARNCGLTWPTPATVKAVRIVLGEKP